MPQRFGEPIRACRFSDQKVDGGARYIASSQPLHCRMPLDAGCNRLTVIRFEFVHKRGVVAVAVPG